MSIVKKRKEGFEHIGLTVCYFCHDGKGKFVMNFRGAGCRDENNRWDIGGGGVDFGMTVEDTVRKEIKEEYGTDVIKMKFLGFRELRREDKGRPTHWITLDYKVQVDPVKVRNGEPHKFDDVKWFTLATVPSPVHSGVPGFLDKYRGSLIH